MTAAEGLRRRASEYELLAWSYAERAELEPTLVGKADASLLVAIALRVVANELEEAGQEAA